MRSAIVLLIIFASLPICFFRPYFGLLMWTWIAYFNPHRLTYGAAYSFPVAMAIAIPTLSGLLFTREKNSLKDIFTRETILLFMLWAWFIFNFIYTSHNTLFASHAVDGFKILDRTNKILLMTVVAVILITSAKKLKYVCYVVAFSIGFYAVKNVIFGLRTSAGSRVWGPPGSFIEDNNFLAAATNMTIPLLFFLARNEKNPKLRLVFWGMFYCSIPSVLLSYSRGGLLGLSVVLVCLVLLSRHKFAGLATMALAGILVISFAPAKWFSRMDEFAHGEVDTSAQGRLNAWKFAIVLTEHYPLTGGGFETFQPELFDRFTPELRFAGPHSIYFEMLGEQGYVGLLFFLALLASCHMTFFQIRRRARRTRRMNWMVPYTYMFQISLLAFMTSGAFLAMAYFDYFWQIVALTAVLRILYRREMAIERQSHVIDEQAVYVDAGEQIPTGEFA